jgi:hypothetical protein
VEAFFPGYAICVERTPKVKEQRFDWLHHSLCARPPSRFRNSLTEIRRASLSELTSNGADARQPLNRALFPPEDRTGAHR